MWNNAESVRGGLQVPRPMGVSPKEEHVSKRTKIILAVVVLVVVAGAAAFFFLNSQGSGPEVTVATVKQTDLGVTVSASGKVAAGLRADVYPPAAGTLDEVYVVDGQKVVAGEKLALMDVGPAPAAARSGAVRSCAGAGGSCERRRYRCELV